MSAVGEVVDAYSVNLVAAMVENDVVTVKAGEFLQPFENSFAETAFGDRFVNVKAVKFREYLTGYLIAAQIAVFEVEGDEPGIAFLHHSLNDCIRHVIKNKLVRDDKEHDKRQIIGNGDKFKVMENTGGL